MNLQNIDTQEHENILVNRMFLGTTLRVWLITFGVGVILILTYVPVFMSKKVIESVSREDRLFEYLGALFFFLTAVLFLIFFFRSRELRLKRLSYLALAVVFILFAGEEISWGQRILGIETPEAVQEVNRQQETNLHNLKWFAGGEGSIPINLEQLFVVFTFTLGLIVPFIATVYQPARTFFNRFMPVLAWVLGLLIPLNYVIQKVLVKFFNRFPEYYHHSFDERPPAVPIYEIREHGYAMILFLLVAYYAYMMWSTMTTPAPEPVGESWE